MEIILLITVHIIRDEEITVKPAENGKDDGQRNYFRNRGSYSAAKASTASRMRWLFSAWTISSIWIEKNLNITVSVYVLLAVVSSKRN